MIITFKSKKNDQIEIFFLYSWDVQDNFHPKSIFSLILVSRDFYPMAILKSRQFQTKELIKENPLSILHTILQIVQSNLNNFTTDLFVS